jgi:hypothetical protein
LTLRDGRKQLATSRHPTYNERARFPTWSRKVNGLGVPDLAVRKTATLIALPTRTVPRSSAERKLRVYRVAGERPIRIKREDEETLVEPLGGEDARDDNTEEHHLAMGQSVRRA